MVNIISSVLLIGLLSSCSIFQKVDECEVECQSCKSLTVKCSSYDEEAAID